MIAIALDIFEKPRIDSFSMKKLISSVKNQLMHGGAYLVVWYMNREQEKGLLRFQFNKGICMTSRHKGYNTLFQVRSIMRDVAIEQEFLNFSPFNLSVWLKKNPIKKYYRNSLKFLREKKNIVSKFKVLF